MFFGRPIKKDYIKSEKEAYKYFLGRENYAKKYYKKMINFGKIESNTKMLDVCCGAGNISFRIARVARPKIIYLIDLNELMLKEAMKHCKRNFIFIKGQASEIDKLIKEKVDVILCTNGFEGYVGDQIIFLKKCSKLLNKKGLLIFDISTSCVYDNYTIKFMDCWREKIVEESASFPNIDISKIKKWFSPFNKVDLKQVLRLVRKQGFKLRLRKYKEPWSVKKEISMYKLILSRSDFFFKNISFAKRKKILLKAAKKVIKKIGLKPLVRYRLFFIARKV